ncbi:MAG TPA: hypothetical protein VIV11_27080, partial [Kofleriaceae bacterium]
LKARRTPPTSRKSMLIAGGVVVFVGSVLVAYFATRKHDTRAKAAAGDTTAVAGAPDARSAPAPDATHADDPWTTSADPDLSPIIKAHTGEPPDAAVATRYKVTIVGVPRGFTLYANDTRTVRSSIFVDAGERLEIEIWSHDRSELLFKRSLRPDRDERIDVTVRKLSDCPAGAKACRKAYCDAHRGDAACPSDNDVLSPFD